MLSLMLASLLNVFVVESPSYAKEMVVAAREVTARYSEIHFTIRTTEQVVEMPPAELKQPLEQASIVVLGRTYGDVAAKVHAMRFPETPARKRFSRRTVISGFMS